MILTKDILKGRQLDAIVKDIVCSIRELKSEIHCSCKNTSDETVKNTSDETVKNSYVESVESVESLVEESIQKHLRDIDELRDMVERHHDHISNLRQLRIEMWDHTWSENN